MSCSKISTLLVISAFFLSGCSQKIEGEAFLKKGDAVLPLADLEVRVVDLDKFQAHLKRKQEGIEKEIENINSKILRLEQSNKSLIESKNAIFNAQMKLLSLGGSWNTNSLGGQYMQNKQDEVMKQGSNSIGSSDDAISKNEATISLYKKEIESLRNGKNGKYFYYSEKNQDGIISTKTQSNGKFEFSLKSSKDSVLLANHNDKYWLIKLNKDDKKINLTESNENGISCEICVFK
jgi:hypothetical protein